MKNTQHIGGGSVGQGKTEAVRPAVRIFISVACLACAGLILVHLTRSKTKQQTQTKPAAAASGIRAAGSTAPKQIGLLGGNTASQPPKIAPGSDFQIQPTREARELVDSLLNLDTRGGPINEAQAAAWKENLRRLIQQGDVSVPAINEFLAKNTDIQFDKETAAKLGYASARVAMIDALMQIGTSNAIGALDSVLQNTEGPQEIAMVTQYLEKTSPGMFLQHAFDAAQRVLSSVANGSMPKVDVAPLFQMFDQYQYGNAYTVPVLKDSASQWNRYATIALAQLPDGAGVPALIQIANGEPGSSPGARSAALQALSGMASQSAGARDTLMGMARQNRLSADDWAALIPFLAGDQNAFQASVLGNPVAGISPADIRGTYIGSNCQSYWTAPLGAMTVSQVSQQSAFVDQMLNVTTDPAGIQALQRARALLDNRRLVLANSSGQ